MLVLNRYKSIVVEEEPYLLELVRYLHLNPLRAKVVSDLRALDRYPWTGYSALLGTVPRACAGRPPERDLEGGPAGGPRWRRVARCGPARSGVIRRNVFSEPAGD